MHAAAHQVLRTQFPRDGLVGEIAVAKGVRRTAGNDDQGMETGQSGDQVFRHTVCEVRLFGRGEIFKRQHGDSRWRGSLGDGRVGSRARIFSRDTLLPLAKPLINLPGLGARLDTEFSLQRFPAGLELAQSIRPASGLHVERHQGAVRRFVRRIDCQQIAKCVDCIVDPTGFDKCVPQAICHPARRVS